MSRPLRLASGALLAAGALAAAHRRLNRLGATRSEASAPFPGAGIVPGGRRSGTMATTLDAPPEDVWPWLAQMGCGRAGWYSWDRLDNGGRPSARHLHPGWQQVREGDRWASTPSGGSSFTVAAARPPEFLALRAPLDLRGRPFELAGPRPRRFSDTLWAFQLREAAGGRTRLLVSGYTAVAPRLPLALANALVWDPAHWIMQRRQFHGLRGRVRRGDGARVRAAASAGVADPPR